MIKVSIIIPVYNVESYLENCLNSVVNQTLKEIEVICINDGSTDSSLNILYKFKDKDNRIIIITKKNEGLGITRNLGLRTARGEYILCLDSDDFITKNTCEVMYDVAKSNNLDFLQIKKHFNYYNNSNKCATGVYIKPFKTDVLSGKEFSENNYTTSFAWGKLWKSKFIKDNKIYNSDYRLAEDQLLTFKAFIFARRFMQIDFDCWNYRIHDKSLTASYKDNYYFDVHKEVVKNMLILMNDHALWNSFGFTKRIVRLMYRISKYSSCKGVGEIRSFRDNIKFINSIIKIGKNRKNRKYKFSLERFFIFPVYIWNLFKY